MIRLIEISPAAAESFVTRLIEDGIDYTRQGQTKFMFPAAQDRLKQMRKVSRHLDFVLGAYGNSHLVEDDYV